MSSSESTIVGRSGRYEIHKITINNRAASNGKRLKLGVVVRSKEWLSKDLSNSFPSCTEYAYIHEIKAGSLADVAGVLVQDVLCTFAGGQSAPAFCHRLIQGGNSDSTDAGWNLIACSDFELLVGRAEYERTFSFYVARKMVPIKASAALKGVTLSWAINARAKAYHNLMPQERARLLQDAKADAKQHFETERDAVLEALPQHIKDTFWTIGFVQWGRARSKTFLPVVIVSPYGVGPGTARDAWMQKFLQRKEKKSLDKMYHLVYWFGEASLEPTDGCFSVMNQDSFVPWEEAKARGLHKVPKKGSKTKIAGLKQINEASRRSLSERRRMLPIVQEFYESLCEADLAQQSGSSVPPLVLPPLPPNNTTGRPLQSQPPTKRRRILTSSRRSDIGGGEVRQEQAESTTSTPSLRLRLGGARTRGRTAAGQKDHVEILDEKSAPAALPDAVSSAVQVSPLSCKESPRHKYSRVASLPTMRTRSSPERKSRPAAKNPERKASAKTINEISSISDNDYESGSLVAEGDRKQAPRSAGVEPSIRCTATGPSVQTVLDTFCNQIQDISRRNAVLKSQHKQLQTEVKTWREQYIDLGGVVHPISAYGSDAGLVENFQSGSPGDDHYLENMALYLGRITKQNSDLQGANAGLESQKGEWRTKVTTLVQEFKRQGSN